MNIYVTGVDSPDPDKWSIWDEASIVVAENKEQAMKLSGDYSAFEIPLDKAQVLMKSPTPNWGDDL